MLVVLKGINTVAGNDEPSQAATIVETDSSVIVAAPLAMQTSTAIIPAGDPPGVGGAEGVVGAMVVGTNVVGAMVVGGSVVGINVVGAMVVGAMVVGAMVVGGIVVGITVETNIGVPIIRPS